MNTTAIAANAIELAELTPQEYLLTIELAHKLRAQKLRVGDKPMPAVETPKRASNRFKRWSDEHTQRLKDFMEDSTIMSDRSQRQALHELCRELGRDESGVKQKIKKLQNGDTQ